MQHSAELNFIIEYARKFDSIFKSALAHVLEAQGYCMPKKLRAQNLMTLSLYGVEILC
jgi:hypothetical protein